MIIELNANSQELSKWSKMVPYSERAERPWVVSFPLRTFLKTSEMTSHYRSSNT